MASPSRNIPAIVAKLKANNDTKIVVEAYMSLMAALNDDADGAAREIARAGGVDVANDLMQQ